MCFLLHSDRLRVMEKKLTNSGPLREPADKHSIYTQAFEGIYSAKHLATQVDREALLENSVATNQREARNHSIEIAEIFNHTGCRCVRLRCHRKRSNEIEDRENVLALSHSCNVLPLDNPQCTL